MACAASAATPSDGNDRVDKVLKAWEAIVPTESVGASEERISKLIIRTSAHVKLQWSHDQRLYFLDSLLATQAVYRESILRMGNAYGFNRSEDREVLFRWCQLLIRHNCQNLASVVEGYLTSSRDDLSTLTIWQAMVDKGRQEMRWKFIAQDIWHAARSQLEPDMLVDVEGILQTGRCLGPF
eukprot:CAMPEP_0204567440 /NCGR_PEP_ID=MMETSP0661-20131031/36608_1 /ASSEMBLY_ACC=CAM_ASM_000606 /TAXON_ID=109239 /ORGANISM="Alexandrium margalefi, Strain AMGDE01CS-322" /LENGTH=181 /DNA_ID=CAMNT_0051575361 /DNA_START=20 /DNA_END=565 /DNA_ORIENTATION=-